MRAYNLTAEDGFKAAALFIFLFLVFQLGAFLGQASARLYSEHETIDRLQSRISLDLQFLDVGLRTLQPPPRHSLLPDSLIS